MRRKPLKLLAYSSVAALALCLHSNAYAQTETVTANLATSNAIDTVVVDPMDFGEFLVAWVTPDTPTLTLTNAVPPATNIAGVVNSTIVQITAPAQPGQVTVEIPAPAVLDMTRGAITDFADAGLTLTSVTYRTATQTSAALPAATPLPVTVLAGATPESIFFGGVITISAAVADNAAHAATFDVTLAY